MTTKSSNRQKHENPLISLGLIGRFQKTLLDVLHEIAPTELLEVGAGEGFLLDRIHSKFPQLTMRGVDVDAKILSDGHELFPYLDLQLGDIYKLTDADKSWDVVLSSEVLEHLERPAEALAELARVSRRRLVLSVPNEPWFRLGNLGRGRHVKRFGNHPEHINLWSMNGFVRFVEKQMAVERVINAFPWTIVVARAK